MEPLRVDRAVGSRELVEPLVAFGLPAELAALEFGDLAFEGRGERGAPLRIGIELKKLPELVQSLRSGRFQGHQLPGMTRTYDRRYLVVEGDLGADSGGHVVARKGRFAQRVRGAGNAMALEQELLTIQTRGGLWLRITPSRRDTLRFIAACYRFWTDKDLDAHKAHMALYAPDLDRGIAEPASDFRTALSVLLPGVSLAGSLAIEEMLPAEWTLARKLQAVISFTAAEWASIATVDRHGHRKSLGASKGAAIWRALHG